MKELFNENVMQALGMMGKGMLGVFVVIGLIALCVVALTKITGRRGDS